MASNFQRYFKIESDDENESDPGAGYIQPSQQRRHLRSRVRRNTILVCGTLTFLNIVFMSLWLRSAYFSRNSHTNEDNCVRPQLIFSSARESGAIQYERQRLFRPLDDNPYTGPPRPEHDAAWNRILEPLTSLITPSEYAMADLGGSTLAMKDGSGYVGELAVYHELHCIRRIRRYLYFNHYYPNASEADLILEPIHIDHCLEYWREAAMCRADSSLATFFWRDGIPTSRAYSDHECVNWDVFDGWARSRMMDMSDPEILEETDRWKYIRMPDGRTALRTEPDVEVHP